LRQLLKGEIRRRLPAHGTRDQHSRAQVAPRRRQDARRASMNRYKLGPDTPGPTTAADGRLEILV